MPKKENTAKDIIIDDEKHLQEKCNVLWVKNDKCGIDFRGYGITINNVNNKIKQGDTITVKYIGTIGDEDFKII